MQHRFPRLWYLSDRVLKCIHPLAMFVQAATRKYDLHIEGTIPDIQQCIFVANHYCIHDIPTACEIIRKHTYILVSDEDKFTMDGLLLSMNGVVWIRRTDKRDRQRAQQDLIAHLKMGHRILMYPEATWNLTPELPVLPMNWGVIKLSKETNVPICPLYLFFTEKVCYAKVGELFVPSRNDVDDIKELRDRMATLFWNVLEKQPMSRHDDIRFDEQEYSIAERYDEYARARKDPVGVREYESQFIYRPKEQVTHEEAFMHLADIIPNHNNAFLFNKRLNG